jgi:hypothetical protein
MGRRVVSMASPLNSKLLRSVYALYSQEDAMGLMDVLGRYANPQDQPPPHVFDDFDNVAREAPPEMLSGGLEDAFRSDATPPFEQMVGQLYDRSSPDVRSSLLREILGRREHEGHLPVNEVENVAREAAQANPSIIQRVSRFYAQHPQLVQTLGQAAIGIAMSGMARRRRM